MIIGRSSPCRQHAPRFRATTQTVRSEQSRRNQSANFAVYPCHGPIDHGPIAWRLLVHAASSSSTPARWPIIRAPHRLRQTRKVRRSSRELGPHRYRRSVSRERNHYARFAVHSWLMRVTPVNSNFGADLRSFRVASAKPLRRRHRPPPSEGDQIGR
jgi:hypothetical protein